VEDIDFTEQLPPSKGVESICDCFNVGIENCFYGFMLGGEAVLSSGTLNEYSELNK